MPAITDRKWSCVAALVVVSAVAFGLHQASGAVEPTEAALVHGPIMSRADRVTLASESAVGEVPLPHRHELPPVESRLRVVDVSTRAAISDVIATFEPARQQPGETSAPLTSIGNGDRLDRIPSESRAAVVVSAPRYVAAIVDCSVAASTGRELLVELTPAQEVTVVVMDPDAVRIGGVRVGVGAGTASDAQARGAASPRGWVAVTDELGVATLCVPYSVDLTTLAVVDEDWVQLGEGARNADGAIECRVGQLLACAVHVDGASSPTYEVIDSHSRLIDSSATFGRHMKSLTAIKQKFPDATRIVCVARTGSGAAIPCEMTLRVSVTNLDGQSVSRDVAVLLVPPSRLPAPLAVSIEPPVVLAAGRTALRLFDSSGAVLNDVRFTLSRRGGALRGRTGEVLRVAPGIHEVAWPGLDARALGLPANIEVKAAESAIDVRLGASFRQMQISVTRADGATPAYAIVTIEHESGAAQTLRSMRPASIPTWVRLGRSVVKVHIPRYGDAESAVEVVSGGWDESISLAVTVGAD